MSEDYFLSILDSLSGTGQVASVEVTVESDSGYTEFDGTVVQGESETYTTRCVTHPLDSNRLPTELGTRRRGERVFYFAHDSRSPSIDDVTRGDVTILHNGIGWKVQGIEVWDQFVKLNAIVPETA